MHLKALSGAQVPLLTVLESVAFERVRGRSPLFQSWFDIQPLSLEGDLSLQGLQAAACGKVRLSRLAVVLRPCGAYNGWCDSASRLSANIERSSRLLLLCLPVAVLCAMSLAPGSL